MPNNLFNFPMYMKQQGQEGAYGNPLAGLMDEETQQDEQSVSQPERRSPFQMIPTRYNPLQMEQQMKRNQDNLDMLQQPSVQGVPSLNAVRRNPNEVRT